MQKSPRQPQSSVMVRRFLKRKSCCHIIAFPQAGIAAPTLIVMQGFEAKKDCSVHFLSHSKYCVYTPILPFHAFVTQGASHSKLMQGAALKRNGTLLS